jgi:hypothetical protein
MFFFVLSCFRVSLSRLACIKREEATVNGLHFLRLGGWFSLFSVCLAGAFLAPALASKDDPSDGPQPDSKEMEALARRRPVAFLETCLRYYDQMVQGYQVVMQKQERLQGKIQKKETIQVAFRENPFSVSMRWLEGARKADRVVYVKGENDDMMLAHPAGVAGSLVKVVKRKVDGPEAKEAGRYPLDQFGIKNALVRAVSSMKAAKENNALEVGFLGEVPVIEAGNKPCYKLRRTYLQPEADGVMELTAYIDKGTWLPVGWVMKGKINPTTGNRDFVAEYFFKDFRLNPEFGADQFKEAALTAP